MFQFNSKTYKILLGICSIIITALTSYLIVQAGSLTPSSTPADTMKTLDDIYYELDKNASAVGSWGLDPSAAPTGTMYTLQQLYDKTPQFHSNPGDVTAGDVCNAKTFYADSSTRLTGERTDCSAGGSPPGVTATGQTTSYTNYDDGYYEKGQALSYTINTGGELGTVTDDNTGLMWKRCTEPDTQTSGCTGTHSTYTWADAITRCEGITYGGHSDWRLPNAKELWSITKLEPGTAPYIDQDAFPGTVSSGYWSSTTYPDYTSRALYVNFDGGYLDYNFKTYGLYVRCVRG